MNKQQGFSLIELLIVVAIIAIIAAIAVPSMLTSRMAANEAGAIQGCRTIGSAEAAYAAINNQVYADITTLVSGHFLDDRFTSGFSGYGYAQGAVTGGVGATNVGSGGFQFLATPAGTGGRYIYGIAPDQVVRYEGIATTAPSGTVAPKCGSGDCAAGDAIGASASAGS
jgi:prepilin-type N-terminal cleavage/methylation domain-containing protein